MANVLDVLVEIRDLLNKTKLPEKKRPQKKRVKPQLKAEPEKPSELVWKSSAFPIEQWKVGTTKRYPIKREREISNRTSWINVRMKRHGFSNHYRYRRVMRHGNVFVEVWRDK